MATTSLLGDLVSEVAGERAQVMVLMPIGVDPHDFQPSSREITQLTRADLVVANGLFLETGVLPSLDAAADAGTNVLELGPLADPLSLPSGEKDPHFWTDPLRLITATRQLAAELAVLDPSVDWSTAAEDYVRRLEAGHEEIIRTLAPIADRRLVTNHDALRYFVERYGFEIVGTIFPSGSTLADPSSAQIAALVREVVALNAQAVFAETVMPHELAEAVAAEAGADVRVVELYSDSLGEPGSGADTLLGMLLTDAKLIAQALE
jgi:zinc/manganese transport system substrate-binding protein